MIGGVLVNLDIGLREPAERVFVGGEERHIGAEHAAGGRLVDRHRDRAADWVGAIGAAVQRQSLKSLFALRHVSLPWDFRLRRVQ